MSKRLSEVHITESRKLFEEQSNVQLSSVDSQQTVNETDAVFPGGVPLNQPVDSIPVVTPVVEDVFDDKVDVVDQAFEEQRVLLETLESRIATLTQQLIHQEQAFAEKLQTVEAQSYEQGMLYEREQLSKKQSEEEVYKDIFIQQLDDKITEANTDKNTSVSTLALAVVGKLLLDFEKNVVLKSSVIENVLQQINDDQALIVYVNQADYDLLVKPQVFSDTYQNLTFKVDEHIKLGGCIVSNTTTTFDGSLEAQIAVLKHNLSEASG